jgi:prevent-host-death family protein
MEASIKDLRLHTKGLIAAIDRGERIVITHRGKPRAQLVPMADDAPKREEAERNPAFGLWADLRAGESVDEQVRRLREPRDLG